MQSLEELCPSKPMDCVATVLVSQFLTPTIKAVRLRLDRPDFRFLPGQSVWPRFYRDGKTFSKIYSIASSPTNCPDVELCVSRVGWSSAYLQDLAIGETIAVRGPYGLLTLDGLPDRPRLYIAEGSGIAPLKSHIDWLYACRFRYPVWLVQANPETPGCLPYQAEWRSLQRRWLQFHYIEAMDASLEQVMAAQLPNLQPFDIDICAVGDRPSQIREAMVSFGAMPSQIRSESFYAF